MKKLLIIALSVCIPMAGFARKPKKKAEPEPAPQEQQKTLSDEECLAHLSLCHESVKNEQFNDAYPIWLELYQSRPDFHKNIYIDGDKILEYKYANAQTQEEKNTWREMIMKLHDERIQYFDDPKYPDAYVLGLKAIDYIEHYPEDELAMPAYQWLKESVEGMGTNSQIVVLRKLVEVSYNIYKSDTQQYGEQFLKDYQTVSNLMEQIIAAGGKRATEITPQKNYIDRLYAVSGAADCGQMDEMYANDVNTHLQDLEHLNAIIKLYRRLGCTESDVYFAAAEAAHKLQPTDESAAGCAKMCVKKEDPKGAIKYYEQAIELATTNEDKADYLYNIALVYYAHLKNFQQAANYAYKAAELNGEDGRNYILIGLCYANAKVSDDPMLNRSVYWVAVDMFRKAKQVDSSCTADANKLINTYSQYFPTKEDIFFHKEMNLNEPIRVGGWINKTTYCTPKAE